jgi:hypothetical protein
MHLVEPVELSNFLVAVISGALVVVFGALYAAAFAFGKLYRKNSLIAAAYGIFGLLSAAVFALASALNLHGAWSALVVVLLAGYLEAPRFIWRLSVASHQHVERSSS